MTDSINGPIGVKDAVKAVRAFVDDLFGPEQLKFAALEEVELTEDRTTWIVTMSFNNPATMLFAGTASKDLKRFIVDSLTAEVTAMRIARS